MTTTEKAQRLKDLLQVLSNEIVHAQSFQIGRKGELKFLLQENKVLITITDARLIAEALASLRWANVFYTNPQKPGELGVEYENFADAHQAHTDVKNIDLLIPFETVGIIRLKDDEI